MKDIVVPEFVEAAETVDDCLSVLKGGILVLLDLNQEPSEVISGHDSILWVLAE